MPSDTTPIGTSSIPVRDATVEAGNTTTEWQVTLASLVIGGTLLLVGFACLMLLPERAAAGERAIEAGQWIVTCSGTGYALARGVRKGLHRG